MQAMDAMNNHKTAGGSILYVSRAQKKKSILYVSRAQKKKDRQQEHRHEAEKMERYNRYG